MLKPCRVLPLAIWTCLCPIWGEDAQSVRFDRQEMLYFKRGSMEWRENSRERLEQFVQHWGTSGEWVIGVPRNVEASHQVALGRIRMIVGTLLELGVVGVKTETLAALPLGEFDPLILGVRGAVPWAGVDPNDDGAVPRPPVPPAPRPKAPPTVPPVPPPPKPTFAPVKKVDVAPAPKKEPIQSLARWMRISGGLEVRENVVEKPPTAQLEARPYPMLSLQADASTDVLMATVAYAKTLHTLSSGKEQADPTNQLDVSRSATSYFSGLSFSVNGLPARVPIQVSYVDETASTTAVLGKGTLLFDRSGSGWVTLMDGVNYAYKRQRKEFALDWCLGNLEKGHSLVSLGLYVAKDEQPFNVHEFGSSINNFIFTSTFHVTGLQVRLKSNPKLEGFHLGRLEVKVGRSTGLTVVDNYQLLGFNVSKRAFNVFGLHFDPHYLMNLGTRGFFQVTLPMDYSRNTFKTQQSLKASGDGTEAGLFGTSYGIGLRVDAGARF